MDNDLKLRRKVTLRAHGKQIVLVKKPNELSVHVLMKAFIWALYLPCYPNLHVEVPVGDRYKPDVVALNEKGTPEFWGEAGHIGPEKIRSLVKRYRSTHFTIAKWNKTFIPLRDIITDALDSIKRQRPVDLLNFPEDSIDRFIDRNGNIHIEHDSLEWVRIF